MFAIEQHVYDISMWFLLGLLEELWRKYFIHIKYKNKFNINVIQIWKRNDTTRATTFDYHSKWMGKLVMPTNLIFSSPYNAPTLFRYLQMRSFMYKESILKTWHPYSIWLGFPYYDVIETASPIPHTAHWVDTW